MQVQILDRLARGLQPWELVGAPSQHQRSLQAVTMSASHAPICRYKHLDCSYSGCARWSRLVRSVKALSSGCLWTTASLRGQTQPSDSLLRRSALRGKYLVQHKSSSALWHRRDASCSKPVACQEVEEHVPIAKVANKLLPEHEPPMKTNDEAGTATCCCALASDSYHLAKGLVHWASCPPVSNRVEDLAPLLRFCRVPLLQEQAIFQEHVAKVTRRSFVQGCNALRQVLSPVCLRRTKALLNLPQPRAIDHEVVFSAVEEDRKNVLLERSRRQLDAAVSGHDHGRTTILQAILQLRIFCNQGTFMSHVQDEDEEEYLDPDEALTLLQEEGRDTCASCATEVAILNQHRDSSSGILGACSHILCSVCWGASQEDSQLGEEYKCPKCDDVFLQAELSDARVRCETPGPAAPTSAKLAKLVEELIDTQGKEKSIVFSVWRKTLDVTASLCSDARIRHVRIDGTVPQAARQQALKQFTNDPTISTLLMTLGTGALGLNLTAATRVHILEPQWNPAVEKQAVGRVVRIGQEKNATVIRYSVKNSVEQQIQMYQKRKLQLAASGFGDGPNSTEFESKLLRATFFTGGKL